MEKYEGFWGVGGSLGALEKAGKPEGRERQSLSVEVVGSSRAVAFPGRQGHLWLRP